MWSKIVFSVWLLIIQNALGDVAETLDATELTDKCSQGDLEGVKQLAATFGNEQVVEARNGAGETCLTCAYFDSKNPDLFSFLLQIGANPNQKIYHTPILSWAVDACHLSLVKTLLAFGADAKYNNSYLLYDSPCSNDEEQSAIVRLLLQHCANPEAQHVGRRTPFKDAVYHARIGVIRVMAKWMEDVETVKKEEIGVGYKNRLEDIQEAIDEGQEERKMRREVCTPPTSAIAQ